MTDRPAAAPLIRLEDVHLSLGQGAGRVDILKGVGLEVETGRSLGIVGPSGSGKSTLLMVMAGLERADSGSVSIAGTDLTRLDEDALARFRGREIGIVFQSFHLIPNMSALENVAVPLELAGRADAFEAARAELEAVGLAHRAGHYPAQMSGGEQQRVAIARALAIRPPLLLADEPTGNLDETTGAQIVELMFEACASRGMTMVLVTHDAALARRCDAMIRVRDGHIETIDAEPALGIA
ncbi:MAG: ABC transporter ATP-binding protein [Stappia sp.]|uniref:ABC transporter ATP-binding protein n=1 Tax=Stappia sp. TaxID=1870903 RepID=UPI000C5F9300|nr:ABC transporter ATP-binding protein [Stappia sp.]MAA98508.1 ABC transporter ATP-binding protein [Stappia sp.]MBM21348.1 ABC transporter ATP-binding protein [Stappia sp.]